MQNGLEVIHTAPGILKRIRQSLFRNATSCFENQDGHFKYFFKLQEAVIHLLANDARYSRQITSSTKMGKTALNSKKTFFFTTKLDLNLRKKLVKFHILNIALYGADNWTLWKVDQK